ncbi:signal peptidase I [Flavobacterium sp. RHBU_3]|uniref:signal peptidase I n=1 Tax=Flavobacterium sp. RHBU_3 TaxID=3391184 RepID=UPI003984FD89
MKKSIKIPLIAAAVFFSVLITVQKNGMLRKYSCNSTANEPGLKYEAPMLVSNVPEYHNGDFITFNYNDKMFGYHTRVYRLVGSPGDVLELKKGVLYINGKNTDAALNLKHIYILSHALTKQLINQKFIKPTDAMITDGGAYKVFLDDDFAALNKLTDKRYVMEKNISDKYILTTYRKYWNVDNFGPLTLPENKYFVLGDNRHNAEDSRYIGLIDKQDITGKVLIQL